MFFYRESIRIPHSALKNYQEVILDDSNLLCLLITANARYSPRRRAGGRIVWSTAKRNEPFTPGVVGQPEAIRAPRRD